MKPEPRYPAFKISPASVKLSQTPMKTIHRAILKELLASFLVGLVALNFVLMTEQILRLTKLLSSVGASFRDMLAIILYLQPQLSMLTVPMAFLIATLLTYGRLNADSEITVLRASGMSFSSISAPALAFGAACFAAALVASFYAAPLGARNLRQSVSAVISERAPYAVEEGIFNTSFRDIVLYVREKPSRDSFSGVFIYDERRPGQPTVIYARSASVSSSNGAGIFFTLRDGHVHIVRGETATDLSFGSYRLALPSALEKPSQKLGELTPAALLREAGRLSGAERARALLEFQRRLTLPALCLLLAFFGPPLAMKAGKTGRLGGLALGLSVFAAYYIAMVYSEGLALSGRLPLLAGAWAPAAVLGALALWMRRKENAR
ncbi:MAG: LptF/LptG family permease [Thermodesulfovibrionales bacterium]